MGPLSTALAHLSPVTLSGQLFDGGILIVCVLCVVVMWIAWGPQWVEEARTWLPRESMPPTPVYRLRFPRSFTQPAAKQGDWKARYGMRGSDGDERQATGAGRVLHGSGGTTHTQDVLPAEPCRVSATEAAVQSADRTRREDGKPVDRWPAGSEPAASLSYVQSATVIPIASRRAK